MKENTNRTNLFLKLDSELVSFLKTQENHKFSRYDAFVWLMEPILAQKLNVGISAMLKVA